MIIQVTLVKCLTDFCQGSSLIILGTDGRYIYCRCPDCGETQAHLIDTIKLLGTLPDSTNGEIDDG